LKPGIELAGKKVLVVGLARTGIATALFCAERGAQVRVTGLDNFRLIVTKT
jgi:UDP-N-acetylmuramoylalanine-D-glutamate ligase